MIEYRYCILTKRNYIIEINARLWGSLALPVFCGMNYPLILYNYYVFNKIENNSYTVGLYARHLFKDIKWFINNIIIRSNYSIRKYIYELIYYHIKK